MTNTKPSQLCKSAGLKSLAELVALSGKPDSTIRHWAKTDPAFFNIVLQGVVAIKNNNTDNG